METIILGAGMTGLAAGVKTGYPVFEAETAPGGICASYYLAPGDTVRRPGADADAGCYRFEFGGGHWIFGGDAEILDFIGRHVSLKRYRRSSGVYLPAQDLLVPYPLQYHLSYLEEEDRHKALEELAESHPCEIVTMEDWVRAQFGPTLNELFFTPFHELYTAGLWSQIGPQDNYKTPLDLGLVRQGAAEKTPAVGYNATFVYPEEGLDRLALRMAGRCDVHYGNRVASIDTGKRRVIFEDGDARPYDRLFSTLPLNQMAGMAALKTDSPPDPYTSVLVLNIGAVRGPRCPSEHWIYVPSSAAGFHRVGFYSNVDADFLPADPVDGRARVSLYVERAFLQDHRPSPEEIKSYERDVLRELQAWGMIESAEVVDATWVEVAYTWSRPRSGWVEEATGRLREHGVEMLGRYGRWHFQGIAASIREGLGLVG